MRRPPFDARTRRWGSGTTSSEEPHPSMNAGAALRLVAVMVLWAACFPLITVGLDLAPHMAFAAMRAAVAGVLLLVLGAVFRRPVPRDVRSWALVVVVGLGATTLGFLGMFHAAEFISPGLATVLSNTQPLLAAVLAYLFLGERLRAFGKIGMLTGFGGMAVIGWAGFSGGGIEGYGLGNAYVLLAAFGVALANVAISGLGGRVESGERLHLLGPRPRARGRRAILRGAARMDSSSRNRPGPRGGRARSAGRFSSKRHVALSADAEGTRASRPNLDSGGCHAIRLRKRVSPVPNRAAPSPSSQSSWGQRTANPLPLRKIPRSASI